MERLKAKEVTNARPTLKPTAQDCFIRQMNKLLINGATYNGCLPNTGP